MPNKCIDHIDDLVKEVERNERLLGFGEGDPYRSDFNMDRGGLHGQANEDLAWADKLAKIQVDPKKAKQDEKFKLELWD